MKFFTEPCEKIFRYRAVLFAATANELRQRYAGSVGGLLWMLVGPLLLMSLYAVIYLFIFRIAPGGLTSGEYLLYIFSGLIPFLGFIDALNLGANSLAANRALLLNTVFPAELLPVRSVLASQGPAAVGLCMTIVFALLLGHASATLFAVPIVWLGLVMFVCGVVWVLSLASLILRDVQQVLGLAAMVLMIISPIAYTLDMVPRLLLPLVYANPLSYFVIALHDLVLYERLPPPEITGAAAAIALLGFGIGYAVFARAKRALLDYA
jgi:lipopolysaccharide transport system permease protein